MRGGENEFQPLVKLYSLEKKGRGEEDSTNGGV